MQEGMGCHGFLCCLLAQILIMYQEHAPHKVNIRSNAPHRVSFGGLGTIGIIRRKSPHRDQRDQSLFTCYVISIASIEATAEEKKEAMDALAAYDALTDPESKKRSHQYFIN